VQLALIVVVVHQDQHMKQGLQQHSLAVVAALCHTQQPVAVQHMELEHRIVVVEHSPVVEQMQELVVDNHMAVVAKAFVVAAGNHLVVVFDQLDSV
jgi:exosome complex RNA-binding protein Rrp42 (RNase PH superfamily)